MATLRKWLDDRGFDWETGKIIVQSLSGYNYSYKSKITPRVAKRDDTILDLEFDDGYGGAESPLFIAEDKDKIYFADEYDGAQNCCSFYKNIDLYLDPSNELYFPGGG